MVALFGGPRKSLPLSRPILFTQRVWLSQTRYRMIRVTSTIDGPPLTFNASVSGLAVYLDNFSLIDPAKGEPLRRKRFTDALRKGADLLFSVTNAAELAGPQGRSLDAVRALWTKSGHGGSLWNSTRSRLLAARHLGRAPLRAAFPRSS